VPRVRRKPRPRDHVVGGWPDGQPEPDAPAGTAYALALAKALRDERERLGLRSDRALERHVGLKHATLVRVLNGDGMTDLEILETVERALGRRVTPDPAQGVADGR
jgi:hypothetical protein